MLQDAMQRLSELVAVCVTSYSALSKRKPLDDLLKEGVLASGTPHSPRLCNQQDLPPFCMSMEFGKELMTLVVHAATGPMIWVNTTPWLRGIPSKYCATPLDFKDSKKAVQTHVEDEWQVSHGRLSEMCIAPTPPQP